MTTAATFTPEAIAALTVNEAEELIRKIAKSHNIAYLTQSPFEVAQEKMGFTDLDTLPDELASMHSQPFTKEAWEALNGFSSSLWEESLALDGMKHSLEWEVENTYKNLAPALFAEDEGERVRLGFFDDDTDFDLVANAIRTVNGGGVFDEGVVERLVSWGLAVEGDLVGRAFSSAVCLVDVKPE